MAPPPLAQRLGSVERSAVRDILALTRRSGMISFAGGLPAPELFDTEAMRVAFATALHEEHARRSLQYSPTEGDPDLRERLAAILTRRGVPSGPEDVLVTTGSQQGLSLVGAALLDPGDVVLVEQPSYLAALQVFGLAGARLLAVPCDEQGIVPDALPSLIARHRPKLLYTIPTFQNPTGRTLPADRRRQLARIAAESGLWVLEDDPYHDLRYEGHPLAPIAAAAEARDNVILASSLSKVLAPGLRLGWLRAPRGARDGLVLAKQAADLHTSTVDQAAARYALDSGTLQRQLPVVRSTYGKRRDALLAGLPTALPAGSTWNHPMGGMFVWARLPAGADAAELLRTAVDHGVAFVPGAPFYSGGRPDRATLRLSFVTHPPAEIELGLSRLREAIAAGPGVPRRATPAAR